MPTKSIEYCRRAAAIEDQQGTVAYEQLLLQAEETSLLSCKRKCQREEVIFSINTARSYILHLRSVRPKIQGVAGKRVNARLRTHRLGFFRLFVDFPLKNFRHSAVRGLHVIPGQQQREKHAQVECKLEEIDFR
jgi:hypothetical protein